MSRVTGPGFVPNFWLISQLFWALCLPQGEAEDEGWALGRVMQLLYIPTPTVGPSGRESYYLFFPCTEHQEGLAERGWATRTSPAVSWHMLCLQHLHRSLRRPRTQVCPSLLSPDPFWAPCWRQWGWPWGHGARLHSTLWHSCGTWVSHCCGLWPQFPHL